METPQPPWATYFSAQSPSQQKSVPDVQPDPPVFQVVSVASGSATGHH